MFIGNNEKVNNSIKNNIFYGIIFISLLGFFLHFVYDLSGKLLIIGIIAPINESVWEHLKLAFFPTILWWTISYFLLKRKNKISFCRYFVSSVVSLVVCPLFIISFYYTYTGAFGFHSTILDIASLPIGATIAQLIALHIYQYAKLKLYHLYLATLILFILIIAFILFTFNPPHLPIFIDSRTGKYGLN